jgi:hypothetical protein
LSDIFDDDDFDIDTELADTENAKNGGVTNSVNNDTPKESTPDKDPLGLISQDLFGLLHGLQNANTITGGLTHGLTKNLRRARRIGY